MTTWIKTTTPCPHCSSKRGYAVASDHEHCFSCGYHSKTQGRRLYAALTTPAVRSVRWEGTLPADYTTTIPKEGLNFLSQYFDPAKLPQNIGYSAWYNRLIFPILYEGKLKCWQGRAIGDHPVKWITVSPKYPWGYKFPYISHKYAKEYVIVEDMLSAIKISQVAPTICLLGCSVNTDLINFLLKHASSFAVWLDGDEAGFSGTKKLLKKLSLCATIRSIRTTHDPKFYSVARIKELLN